jgi:hypothetical protein
MKRRSRRGSLPFSVQSAIRNPKSAIRNSRASLPRHSGIMIRALTVKDILDEQIAKKLA